MFCVNLLKLYVYGVVYLRECILVLKCDGEFIEKYVMDYVIPI
jgi:hypothetical protein